MHKPQRIDIGQKAVRPLRWLCFILACHLKKQVGRSWREPSMPTFWHLSRSYFDRLTIGLLGISFIEVLCAGSWGSFRCLLSLVCWEWIRLPLMIGFPSVLLVSWRPLVFDACDSTKSGRISVVFSLRKFIEVSCVSNKENEVWSLFAILAWTLRQHSSKNAKL